MSVMALMPRTGEEWTVADLDRLPKVKGEETARLERPFRVDVAPADLVRLPA